MADHTGIQRISTTLETVLKDRMDRQDVTITHGLPRTAAVNGAPPKLNLYLYHVSENAAFRNAEDPRRAAPGAYGSPPLALELGFLMTSYGVPPPGPAAGVPVETLAELDAQAILADGMRALHEVPIVTAQTPKVRAAGSLLDPGLAFEFEAVRITPRQLSLDELTKLWTSLKEDFQRSVAYEVSVIRITRPRPQIASAPVLTRGITVRGRATLAPVLEGFDPDSAAANQPITLLGGGLDDPTLEVIATDAVGTLFPAVPTPLAVTRVPPDVQFTFPTSWMPGPKSIELRVTYAAGHTASSRPRAVNLRPLVTNLSVQTGSFDGATTVTITGSALGRSLAGSAVDPLVPTVLFGSYPITAANLTLAGLPTQLDVLLPVPDPADPRRPRAGQQLPVRVRVNGVESASARRNPSTGILEMDPALLFTVT